jgi:chromosome segregation ATPase
MRSREIQIEAAKKSVPDKTPLVPYVDLDTIPENKLASLKNILPKKEQLLKYYKEDVAKLKRTVTKTQKSLAALMADPSADSKKIKLLKTKLKKENADLKLSSEQMDMIVKANEQLRMQIQELEQQVKQNPANKKPTF